MSDKKPTSYHVRHDLRPDLTFELLTLLHALPDGQQEEDLQRAADMQGYSLRQRKNYNKLLRSLDELELIERSRKSISLTEQGRIVANVMIYQRDLLTELVHIIYYTGYDNEDYKRFSWSYRTLCNWLWDSAPCEIHRDKLVNVVSQAAQNEFDEQGISFSTQSVSGILHWVTSLNPPCVDNTGNIFNRRNYCPVETFMVALDHVYRLKKEETLSIPLNNEIREQVCRICLITPESFSEMLELAERTFDAVQVWRKRGDRLVVSDFSWQTIIE